MTIGELLKAIGGPNNECDPDTPIRVVVSKPGIVGATPTVGLESACYGFDWNRGKFMLYADKPLMEKPDE